MGRLTVTIVKATLTDPTLAPFVGCNVSHVGRKPFYNSLFLNSASTVRWNDTFTIDVPSRRSTKLEFGLASRFLIRGRGVVEGATKILGEIPLSLLSIGQKHPWLLELGAFAVVSFEFTFVPCVVPSGPLKLLGGWGPTVHSSQYVREDSLLDSSLQNDY
ncbi:hypothetical protein DL95DRAFT_44804 [Leptodontidium sp. 2 PMI_412]|nr:hypothetical protein DL95DRAFT_44804 [Leptodontidium sp. 2 PMI_412]